MEYKRFHHKRWLRHLFSIPFIWMMLLPLVILDIFMEIYHRICFRLYGVELVVRKQYIRIDRGKLKYLNVYDKVNCMYCGYANGLMHYSSEIAACTEKYWCGIKHQQGTGFKPPEHHKDFLEYGDEKSYKKLCKLQKK
jgi:hypothetical protein